MSGNGGSKKRGFGMISKELKEQQEEAKLQANKLEKEFKEFSNAISDNTDPRHNIAIEKLGLNTIAFRAGILHDLLKEDCFKKYFWRLILVIGFIMEFMPIITKIGSIKTAYELDQEALELIMENRRRQVVEKSNFYTQIGLAGRMAEESINKKSCHPLLN